VREWGRGTRAPLDAGRAGPAVLSFKERFFFLQLFRTRRHGAPHRFHSPYFKNAALFNHAHFHFKKLTPGSYILAAWVRGYGLYERSVEIGPSEADAKSQVTVDLRLDLHAGRPQPVGTGMFVSVRNFPFQRRPARNTPGHTRPSPNTTKQAVSRISKKQLRLHRNLPKR